MRDFVRSRRAPGSRPSWARAFQRGALLLAASVLLFWSAFALGRGIVPLPGLEILDGGVLLAWFGVVVQISAWPDLSVGLRELRARQPTDPDAVIAWRAYVLTLGVAVVAVVAVLVQHWAIASTDAGFFFLSRTVLGPLGWTLVPILALHGIVFGRVARSLDPRFRDLTQIGALLLFTVAAVTTVTILESPGATAFVQAWRLGGGLLPVLAAVGYGLIAFGMTAHPVTMDARIPTTRTRLLRSSAKRPREIFR